MPGYCTVDDVRRVLQEADLSGALGEDNNQAVVDAITGQSEWLQETTNRHWFVSGGASNDPQNVVYTDTLDHSDDEQDVPSSPHADHTSTFRSGTRQARYPKRMSGPYTRVTLTRRDVQSIDELLVRDSAGEWTDWTTEHTQGRGDDYYLQVDDHSGFTRLYLHTGTLPRLRDYDNAVVVSYSYGIDGLTDTVRRAIAMRAAAELVVDDELQVSIPDSGQLVNVETKAQQWRQQAMDLLDIHI